MAWLYSPRSSPAASRSKPPHGPCAKGLGKLPSRLWRRRRCRRPDSWTHSLRLFVPLSVSPNSRRLPAGLCQMDDAVGRSCVCCIVYVSKGSPFGLPHKASRNSQQWQQKQADLSFPLQRGGPRVIEVVRSIHSTAETAALGKSMQDGNARMQDKELPFPTPPQVTHRRKGRSFFFQCRSLLCSLGIFSPNSHAIMSSSFSTHSLWGSSP